MAFKGTSFIFNDIPSDYFGLIIADFSKGNMTSTSAGNEIKLSSQTIKGNPRQFIYGVDSYEPLIYNMTIVSEEEVPRDKVSIIENWLFGQICYKKLQIIQDDMYGVYYNCRLTNAEIVTIGNVVHGWKFKVECDAPWAWQEEPEYSIERINGEYTFQYFNESQFNENTYPKITFTVVDTCNFEIFSDKYPNKTMILNNLIVNENITIDGENQQLYSSNNIQLLDRWNKKWFRLVPESNTITIRGNIKDFKMSHQVARKVGA